MREHILRTFLLAIVALFVAASVAEVYNKVVRAEKEQPAVLSDFN